MRIQFSAILLSFTLAEVDEYSIYIEFDREIMYSLLKKIFKLFKILLERFLLYFNTYKINK